MKLSYLDSDEAREALASFIADIDLHGVEADIEYPETGIVVLNIIKIIPFEEELPDEDMDTWHLTSAAVSIMESIDAVTGIGLLALSILTSL